ncbi:MAG TPA: acyltransferase [Candidatus Binatia bacterium]|nr:acyltransferase [Candidatus Binatia bacterium]
MKRILPISSIRFILAIWVFLSHFPYPILVEPQFNPFFKAARFLLHNCFNGAAAVMAFFVISGFCIHFPNRKGFEMPSWTAYYARRYLRIILPMAVAIGLAVPIRLKFGYYVTFILWSLVCEEIYYLIYPALLRLRDLVGWRVLMALAWLGALLTILTDPAAKEYHEFGLALTWALGLPCWLLGARMAERLDSFYLRSVTDVQIWGWRCGIWILSVAFSILRFHANVGFPWTLNIFAIAVASWLEREISYYRQARAPRLERFGEASYSVYLTHMHGAMLASLVMVLRGPWAWWLTVLLTALFASLFYWCVERPSHQLARRCSHTLRRRDGTLSAIEQGQVAMEERAS